MFLAFCDNPQCGAIFPAPNLFGGSGTATVHMTGTRYGPCPNCGGFGHIPDGVYSYANHAVEFIRGPKESILLLKRVESLLKELRHKSVSKEDVVQKVREVSPAVADAIAKAPQTAIIQQWIQIAIALVTLAIIVQTTYFNGNDKELEEKFIEHLLSENQELKSKLRQTLPTSSPKAPRNSPCPCGSSKKYKKCCGNPARENPS